MLFWGQIVTFYYPCMAENVMLLGQFIGMEILMDLQVLNSSEFYNPLFICVHVCVLNITQKQMVEKPQNLLSTFVSFVN